MSTNTENTEMAVRPNIDKPLIYENILVKSYLRLINRKLSENMKPSFIEYLAVISFTMIIIHQINVYVH